MCRAKSIRISKRKLHRKDRDILISVLMGLKIGSNRYLLADGEIKSIVLKVRRGEHSSLLGGLD
jgi:hypothetical protein